MLDVNSTSFTPILAIYFTDREEWGNPNEEKYFSYMESYSPYDNVVAQDYPAVLGTPLSLDGCDLIFGYCTV